MPEHIYTIYLITCINNKPYIGETRKLLEARWKEHIRDTKHGSNCLLHRAIRKYSPESFTKEIVYQSWDEDHCLNIMEEYFIRKFKSHMSEGGYNMTLGGGGIIGYRHSEEARRKISEGNKGQIPWSKGKNLSEEHKIKIGNGNRGKKHPPEYGQAISKAKLGKKHSEETRIKQSERMKGNIPWNKGKTNVYSEETKRKMSIAHTKNKNFRI